MHLLACANRAGFALRFERVQAFYSEAMLISEQNVELVSDFFQALNIWLRSYWSDPGRGLGGPEIEEVFDRLDPDAEWDWVFNPETFRGRDEILRAVADWIETVSDWRIAIDEVIAGPRIEFWSATESWRMAGGAALPLSSAFSSPSPCATAKSRVSTTTPRKPKPSKPSGWRSRRCRTRTWR